MAEIGGFLLVIAVAIATSIAVATGIQPGTRRLLRWAPAVLALTGLLEEFANPMGLLPYVAAGIIAVGGVTLLFDDESSARGTVMIAIAAVLLAAIVFFSL